MSAPDITEVEISAVTDVLRSGHLSLGPRLDAFEREFAAYVGAQHAVGVSSGTSGLHLAVLAAGIGPGDLVITTPFSFVASSNCLLYAGAEPLFVDVEPRTGNIDVSLVETALAEVRGAGPSRRRGRRGRPRGTGPIKAILPVHVFGQPADMDAIMDVARTYDVAVIEDACEAVGAEYNGRRAGALGDVAVFGFYPNKQLTTGEGGMVVTDRDDWAARMRSQRNQGRDLMDAWLRHDRLGFNYRLSELAAALGLAQLSRLDSLLAARERVAGWYNERLASAPGISVPDEAPPGTRPSWFAYVIRLAPDLDRDGIMADLAVRGIPSRTYFAPIHLQPFYARQFGFRPGDFPVAEALGRTCLALPFSGTMTEAQVDRVCTELMGLVARHAVTADGAALAATT
jgi:dTDP-4-amino-4,6-dideoxygalactose transaminase